MYRNLNIISNSSVWEVNFFHWTAELIKKTKREAKKLISFNHFYVEIAVRLQTFRSVRAK